MARAPSLGRMAAATKVNGWQGVVMAWASTRMPRASLDAAPGNKTDQFDGRRGRLAGV